MSPSQVHSMPAALIDRLREALTDRYRVEREVGRGGMATVFLAEDLKHKRQVAIKVLLPDIAAALGHERFLQEIEIAAGLHHPHILPLYDSGDADGLLYYVMPFVEGETLRDLLNRQQRLPLADALRIACEVADALATAHRRGVVHRDIKPENILLSGGHAVIADFGVARAVASAEREQLTVTGLAVGTPLYMSPEQALGDPGVDERSDIYSMGCVTYEMLAGDPPFAGASHMAIVARKALEPPPPLSGVRDPVPQPLEDAIARSLAADPLERFSSADEFAEAVAGAAHSSAPAAPRPPATASTPSIAVLPFVNMSGDPENEYLSDGISEELIHALARVEGLRVAARTSAFAFKGKLDDIRAIGRRLSVGAVLEGSMRRAGKRLRVTAQLIDVADGYDLWAGRFDREIDDVFAVQDEIAGAIADTLRGTLLGDERPPFHAATSSLTAYERYLKGRYYWNQRTAAGLHRSVEYFRQALADDPQFALALAGLADAHATLGLYGFAAPGEVMPLARDAAQRALAMDPTLAAALTSLGCVRSLHDWNWETAERDFLLAIQQDRHYATAYHWYAANHLTPLGRFDEARRALERAQQLEPLSSAVSVSLGLVAYFEGDHQGALAAYDKVIQFDQEFGIAHYFRGQALAQAGAYPEALQAYATALDATGGSPEVMAAWAHALARAGQEAESRELLGRLAARRKEGYVSPTLLAQVHTGLGETDDAFARLREALQERATDLAWLKVRPVFEPLRSDARFTAILEQVGLAR
jgi:serine/threonine-protein kinase